MQQWLTVIIVLLIVGVLLDGIRRMRQSRRSSLKMSLSMHKGTSKEDLQGYGSELPNGGARVVTVRKPDVAKQYNHKVKEIQQQKKQTVGRRQPPRIPQQVALNLEESVPMLMDSVMEEEKTQTREKLATAKNTSNDRAASDVPSKATSAVRSARDHFHRDLLDDVDDGGRIEPKISASSIDTGEDDEQVDDHDNNDGYDRGSANRMDEVDDDTYFAKHEAEEIPHQPWSENDGDELRNYIGNAEAENDTKTREELEREDVPESADDILGLKPIDEDTDYLDDYVRSHRDPPSREEGSSDYFDVDEVDDSKDLYRNDFVAQELNEQEEYEEERAFEQDTDNQESESDEHYIEPEVVLVINVMAPKGHKLVGEELLRVVLAEGMRFGSMDIFHRHSENNGEGSILYSMANIVVPGTFDLKNMREMLTPGVSLFLALPLEEGNSSLNAFSLMVRTAKAISTQLGAELKDENRSVLTPQTIEHYRQRIQEFERKQLSKAPA